jgi:hypothetical protein
MSKAWDVRSAPLARERLDVIAPLVRIIFGIIFIAWSWVSTVLILGLLLSPVLTGDLGGIPSSYIVAFGFAILISVAEWVTSDRWARVYWGIVLILDTPFTAWQTHEWLYKIVDARVETVSTQADVAIWIVSLVGGVVAAMLGEGLLVGKRKGGN